MILPSFALALGQMSDRRFRSVLWRGIGVTIAVLVGLYAVVLGLIQWVTVAPVNLPFIGPVTWLGNLLSLGSLGLMIVLSIFLMVPVASAITSLFLDEIAEAVEDKHFPELPPMPAVGFVEGLRDTVGFLGVIIGANLMAIALYVVLPFAAIFIFYAMNGFLLGREYFQLAATRRIGRKAAIELRKKHQSTIWLAGCVMAVPLSFPFVNLVIPVLGAATFTHLFHRLHQR